jgi:phosphoribosylaminoimidazole (AIR) synthetase
LAETNGWYDPNLKPKIKMHAIAHISGGGIVGKFGEDILFPRGLSAELTELFDPPDIMRNLAEWRGFTDEEIYSTWNGGQGILAVIDEKDVNFFITWAHNYFNSTGREGVGKQGVAAKEVGRITITKPGDKPRLLIKSRFSGKNILFYPNPKEK